MGFTKDLTGDNSLSEGSAALATTQWSTVFEQPNASQLVKGKLLGTIPAMGKQWQVSFEVFPDRFNRKGALASLLHMVTEEKGTKYGKRIPAISMDRGKGLLVSTTLGKKPIYNKMFRSNVPALRKWTKIKVIQSMQGEDYIYSIKIGEKGVFSLINTRPREFYDVRVYAGSPLSPPLTGSIRNLKIEVGVEKCSSMKEGVCTLPLKVKQTLVNANSFLDKSDSV